MGELGEQRWAVISERGCEAYGMSRAEAATLMNKLTSEKVHGLCVVTNDAARHLPRVKSPVSMASPQAQEARPEER